MKIAILHEMLIKLGGAEKVVENIQNIFPKADLYTLMYDEKAVGKVFPKQDIHPSCFKLRSQKLYTLTKKQRLCLPFMTKSVQSLDFSSYDVVIVSSSGFAHGLITGHKTKRIIYYHAPARYMWDWTHEYRKDTRFDSGLKGFLYGALLCKLRQWDFEAGQKGNIILANSCTTQKRITKYYRRQAEILYPPIETERFAKELSPSKSASILKKIGDSLKYEIGKNTYYIILSALTEFKRIDIAIQAFKQLPNQNLLIIGKGEYEDALKTLAKGKTNIHFAGAQYGDDLVALVQNSLGLIFPGEEDFGIVPIEIMAAGKAVFALKKGGLTETVIAGKTGDFFTDENGDDFIENFKIFHANTISNKYLKADCQKHAQKYDKKVFETKLKSYVIS